LRRASVVDELYRKTAELLQSLGVDRETVALDPRRIVSSALYIVMKFSNDPPPGYLIKFHGCVPIASRDVIDDIMEQMGSVQRERSEDIEKVANIVRKASLLLGMDIIRALEVVSCMIALCSEFYPPFTKPYSELARREAGVGIDALRRVYEVLKSAGLCS